MREERTDEDGETIDQEGDDPVDVGREPARGGHDTWQMSSRYRALPARAKVPIADRQLKTTLRQRKVRVTRFSAVADTLFNRHE